MIVWLGRADILVRYGGNRSPRYIKIAENQDRLFQVTPSLVYSYPNIV